jgi:hypothetical protein
MQGRNEPAPPGKNKYGKTYRLRDGVASLYSKKISLVLAGYGAEPAGSKKSMGLYSKAVAQVTAALTEDELEAARQLIHTWNTEGAPPPLQRK